MAIRFPRLHRVVQDDTINVWPSRERTATAMVHFFPVRLYSACATKAAISGFSA